MRALESASMEERAAMGKGAREAVIQTFDIAQVVARWEELFDLGLAAAAGARTRRANLLDPSALEHALGTVATAAPSQA